MNRRHPLLASVLLLLLAPLPAQTAATTPPHVLVESVGPAGWRARFAPTNLGTLLASEQGRELWEPGMLPVIGWLQQTLGDGPHERVLGYGGRIRIAVWLQPGDLIEQRPFAAALVLEGDGHTDLQALAGDVQKLQTEAGGDWSDLDVGGLPLRVLAQGDDRMTAPVVGEHHLLCVAAAADDLATALANARAFVGTCDGKPPAPDTAALRVEMATPALLDLARAAHERNPDRSEWPTWRALGVECLGRSQWSLTTAGPRVLFEMAQTFADSPRGLFAALFRTTAGMPSLQRLLPDGRSSWKLGRFDALALYDAIVAACVANEVDVVAAQKEMRESMGVDLRDDLIAHLGDEVMLHGASFTDVDRLERAPWLLAFRLQDAAAFAASLETALANGKPMLTREATVEHGSAKLYRYGNMFRYDLWFAVGGDLFVIAGGELAEDRLTALFDAAAAPVGDAAPAMPPALTDVQRYLPAGTHGAAVGDLDSLAALPLGWWLGMVPEVVPFLGTRGAAADDPEAAERVRELLQRHQLDLLRTATGYAEHTWRWRVFW